MKTKRYIRLILCVLLLGGLLTGCGSTSGSKTEAMNYAMDSVMQAPALEEAGSALLSDSGSGATTPLPEGRKWIVTVNLSAETEDLDGLSAALNEAIIQLGGYVEDQQVNNGSAYSGRRYRSTSLTVRVPASEAEKFTARMSEISNVVSSQTSREDVTLSYVATESRMTALQTEEARLLELMAQAETMSDLLEIEQRLTDVRYELESVTSQLRLYDNRIDYATIYLTIREVQEYTPVEEPSLWERISGGFVSSLKGLGQGLLDLLVWIIVCSPYLVVIALVVLAVVRLAKRIKKRRKAKKAPKDQSQQP